MAVVEFGETLLVIPKIKALKLAIPILRIDDYCPEKRSRDENKCQKG